MSGLPIESALSRVRDTNGRRWTTETEFLAAAVEILHAIWRVNYSVATPRHVAIPKPLRIPRPYEDDRATKPDIPRTQAEIVTDIRKFREVKQRRGDRRDQRG